jgi:hypothetical protein
MTEQADALAQEHAQELSELDQLLQEASRAAAEDAARDPELQDSAERLREALSRLPSVARFPGTADGEAATARNFGEAMADALESGRLPDAIDRGAAALESLKRAEALRDALGGMVSESELSEAKDALEQAQKQAQKQAQRGRERQLRSPETQEQLQEQALQERQLAERAKELARRGDTGEAKLPDRSLRGLQQAARLMEDAASAMDRGDVEAARQLAEDAQRQLERAQPEKSQAQDRKPGEGDEGDSGAASSHGSEVPGESRDRAKDFRERVEKGLGRYSGRYGPAVRRYAEDLK